MKRRSREPDGLLLSVGWGALWASALGMCFVAPTVISSHHIHPQRLTDWLVVSVGFAALFAIGGAFLGFICGLIPTTVESAVGGFRMRSWAYALFIGPLLAFSYLGENFLIQLMVFRSLDGFRAYARGTTAVAITAVVGSAAFFALYRHLLTRPRVSVRIFAWILCSVTVVGFLAGTRSISPLPLAPATKLERTRDTRNRPLVFIGLDGATWRVLQPAMATGRAPTFRRLAEAGSIGTIEALWPPYWSSAAWASILTGLPQSVTGVYEDLAVTGFGLSPFQFPLFSTVAFNPVFALRGAMVSGGALRVSPPPRALLNGKPVWQLLHESGVNTAVVRFRFTYPPEGQGDIVISDWAGHDEWESVGVRREMGPDTVTPRTRADELLAPFRKEGLVNPALFARLLPGPVPAKPHDAISDPFEALRIACDIDERTFDSAESVLNGNPLQPFLAVYIGGLDSVEHAFWQYRFPGDFTSDLPAKQDVERLGPVIDRYVQYVDERLSRILSLYAVTPNVVVVSDHGHGASTTVVSNWRGWHTKEGIFLAAGPDIARNSKSIRASYYDVLPTLAGLKGFRVNGPAGHTVVTGPTGVESPAGTLLEGTF